MVVRINPLMVNPLFTSYLSRVATAAKEPVVKINRKTERVIIKMAAAVAGACAVVAAIAAPNPATTTFQVKFTVNKACSVSATNLDFGTQDATATNVPGSTNGTITVTCSKGTAYTIGLLPSNNSSTGAGTMAGATTGNTDKVPYQLYQDSGLATVWGNTASTNTVGGSGTGSAQAAVTVYGKVASANYTPDAYADTVTVNVVY